MIERVKSQASLEKRPHFFSGLQNVGIQLEIISRMLTEKALLYHSVAAAEGVTQVGVCGKSATERKVVRRPQGLLPVSAVFKEPQQ